MDAAELTDPATGTTCKVQGGDYSVSHPGHRWCSKEFTGELTAISENNRYACENALSATEAAAVKGKWVLIDWAKDDGELACGSRCASTISGGRRQGVLLAGNDEEPGLGIAVTIPCPVSAWQHPPLGPACTDHRSRSGR